MESDPQARFVNQLKELRTQAGGPSLADLAKQDPNWLKPQTMSDLLSGKFKRLPSWDRIAAFVTACVRIGAAKKLVMPPEDLLLNQWRHRHELLSVAFDQTPASDLDNSAEDSTRAPAPEQIVVRRRFGAVPPRAGAFQHRAVAKALDDGTATGGTTVLTGAPGTLANVLAGMGGVGKTQLAADHAHTLWDSGRVEVLVWISARTRDAITAAYAEASVELLGQDPAMPERAWRRLLGWFAETSSRWLVVLDDLRAPADLVGLWPPHSPGGQVVVTTRCRDAALHADRRRIVNVGLFTPNEALTYLTEKLPDRARTDTEIAELAGLAEDLGWLPLALAQAAAYLANKPLLTCTDYRAKLADRRTALSQVLPQERDLPDEHERTVAATWSVSIDAADQLEPAGLASPVLELAALLDPTGIPTSVFAAEATTNYLAARLERDLSAEDVLGGLECLRRFSLLTLDPDQPHRAVRAHALVQRAVRDVRPTEALGDLAWAAADAIQDVWPPIETDQELIQALRSNTSALHDIAEEHLWQPAAHPVLFHLARSLGDAGLVDSAITLGTRLHQQELARLGPDHPDTLTARHNLAVWHSQAGEPVRANETEQLLTDMLRVLGPDHPNTLAARQNLARWRGAAGDSAGAVAAFEELVTDVMRVLGPDHPNTFNARQNLAYWRGVSGESAGAANETEQLLTDMLRVLGPDHPNILSARHDLARWRGEAEDPAGAVTAFEELLTDMQRVLGPDHPDTLATRNSLACWRAEAGDPAGAVTAFEELVADVVRVLGPDHPDNFTARTSLAHWLEEAGDSAGAVTAFERVLTDLLQALGRDHPDTLATRGNLAYWRGKAGDPAGAANETEQLLADMLRVLGPDHPNTLTTRNNLAHWRGEAGDPAGAVTAFEELLADMQRVLGPDHPDTLATRNSLARWREEERDPASVAVAYEQVLTDRLRVLDPDHPDTLAARGHLAYWRGEAGDSAGAAAAFEELLTDMQRVLGPDHPDTLATRHNAVGWRRATGEK